MVSSRALAACLALVAVTAQAGSDPADPAMLKLASHSGCLTCHHVAAAPAADGALPIGPAWEDVALRYRGKADAAEQLVRTVLTGSNPYGSHWKGRAAGLAMPPNAVAISEPDTRALVRWILALEPPAAAAAPAR